MNTISDTCTSASAPAGYTPTQDDLDEFHRCRLLQEVVETFPDLPPELRWGLLAFAADVLAGRSTTSPRSDAHV